MTNDDPSAEDEARQIFEAARQQLGSGSVPRAQDDLAADPSADPSVGPTTGNPSPETELKQQKTPEALATARPSNEGGADSIASLKMAPAERFRKLQQKMTTQFTKGNLQ